MRTSLVGAATHYARLRAPVLAAGLRPSSNLARIKELRERSGAPMHEVKSALVATSWDIEAALEELRSRGHLAASKKAARVAAEGLVGVASSAHAAVLVELNCETDFVARNPKFQALLSAVAASALKLNFAALQPSGASATATLPEDLMQSLPLEQGGSASQAVTALAAEVRENVKLRQIRWLAGTELVFGAYAHGGPSRAAGRIGSLVALHTSVKDRDACSIVEQLAGQLAMHVAASDPQYLSLQTMPTAVVDAQRAAFQSQARTSGKPTNIADKMVEGWMKKWQSEACLLSQNFIMDDSLTVQARRLSAALAVPSWPDWSCGTEPLFAASTGVYLPVQAAVDGVGAKAGSPLTLARFVRLRVGDGVDKVEKDFAAEVAAAARV